jgi:hypothetical protein
MAVPMSEQLPVTLLAVVALASVAFIGDQGPTLATRGRAAARRTARE